MTDTPKNPPPKKSRRALWIVLLIIALLVVCTVIWHMFIREKQQPPKTPVVAVAVAPVAQEDAPIKISALGNVRSVYTVVVKSRVDGELVKIHFKEGQFVKAGQLLAELDVREHDAALKQAQGQLMKDMALLKNARADLKRYQNLWKVNSVSRQTLDTQTALVRQYEGAVKTDRAAIDNAKLQITYSRITAPISGRIGLHQTDLGNIVHASDVNGIATITQEEPIDVVFSVAEADLTAVLSAYRQNPRLTVEVFDRENKTKLGEGKLVAIDNKLNQNTGTVSIKASFENKDGALYPNQFVHVLLNLGDRKNAVTVPSAAVSIGKLGTTVYTVEPDNTVRLVQVKTGPLSGEKTIIEEGLTPGQVVVTDGLDKLRDKAPIRIVEHRNIATDGQIIEPQQAPADADAQAPATEQAPSQPAAGTNQAQSPQTAPQPAPQEVPAADAKPAGKDQPTQRVGEPARASYTPAAAANTPGAAKN